MNVIVSGIPRSGTTMVARAIAGLPPKATWPSKKGKPVNGVWKYHRPIDDAFCERAKVLGFERGIFVFGDPVLSIISTRRNRWDQNHLSNMGCDRPLEDVDIYREDALGYERLFDTWLAPHDFPVLALRYDALWDHQDILSDFVGRYVVLPARQRRTTDATLVRHAEFRAICETYARLTRKVRCMTDAHTCGRGDSPLVEAV